jgi:hypothetical protein
MYVNEKMMHVEIFPGMGAGKLTLNVDGAIPYDRSLDRIKGEEKESLLLHQQEVS